MLDENGVAIRYATAAKVATVSQRCFGGKPSACRELITRKWDRVFGGGAPRIISQTNDRQNASGPGPSSRVRPVPKITLRRFPPPAGPYTVGEHFKSAWSLRMQMAGQVECKQVVSCNAIGWSSGVQFRRLFFIRCHTDRNEGVPLLCPVVGAVLENAHATFLGTQGIVLTPGAGLKIRQSLCILPVNLGCLIHSSPRGGK